MAGDVRPPCSAPKFVNTTIVGNVTGLASAPKFVSTIRPEGVWSTSDPDGRFVSMALEIA